VGEDGQLDGITFDLRNALEEGVGLGLLMVEFDENRAIGVDS